MGFFDRLFGRGGSEGTPLPAFPHSVTVAGSVRVTVFAHEFPFRAGPVPCWSFVSDGLRAHGQAEIVLTLRRPRDKRDASILQNLPQMFGHFAQFADKGAIVRLGGQTEFGPTGFLGHARVRGLRYVAPQNLGVVDSSSYRRRRRKSAAPR